MGKLCSAHTSSVTGLQLCSFCGVHSAAPCSGPFSHQALLSCCSHLFHSLWLKAQMGLWGWRLPFLVAVPFVVTAFLLRVHMVESDEFLAVRRVEGGHADEEHQGKVQVATPAAREALGQSALSWAGHRLPMVRLLRRRPIGLLLDVTFVTWLASAIYVVVSLWTCGCRLKQHEWAVSVQIGWSRSCSCVACNACSDRSAPATAYLCEQVLCIPCTQKF
jgi:hypothetical protein